MIMQQPQTPLFGHDGVLTLLRQYDKSAAPDQLYEFMIQNYPVECCMTKPMLLQGLRKLAKRQLIKLQRAKDRKGISGRFIWQLITEDCQNKMPARMILPSAQTKILNIVENTQEGLCYHCRKKMYLSDSIISRQKSHSRRYYHLECAKRLKIIQSRSGWTGKNRESLRDS